MLSFSEFDITEPAVELSSENGMLNWWSTLQEYQYSSLEKIIKFIELFSFKFRDSIS